MKEINIITFIQFEDHRIELQRSFLLFGDV